MSHLTIVEFANEVINQFSNTRKRKLKVRYRGIELIVTKKSTVFTVAREYKEKDKVRSENTREMIRKQIERLERLEK